ncbi:hypothetical protein JMJ77_0013527, partial [Colletotrichum scovillei]
MRRPQIARPPSHSCRNTLYCGSLGLCRVTEAKPNYTSISSFSQSTEPYQHEHPKAELH